MEALLEECKKLQKIVFLYKHFENLYMKPEFKRLYYAAFFPLLGVVLMFSVFLLKIFTESDLYWLGIYPRDWHSLLGIVGINLIHSGWEHLGNNTISFLILSVSLFYVYREIAQKVFWSSMFMTGAILWLIGRDNWHIGCSGWIYSLAFFLFFGGILRKHVPLIALSLLVVFIYGNMVWHVFPWKVNDPISWEGHLAGGISGLFLAILYRKSPPQRKLLDWEMEEDSNSDVSDDADAYWAVKTDTESDSKAESDAITNSNTRVSEIKGEADKA